MLFFNNLLKWSLMTIVSIITLLFLDFLLVLTMIILIKLPTWVWIVLGLSLLWFCMQMGIALAAFVINWLISLGARGPLSPKIVKFLVWLNGAMIIGYWWLGNDKFSFQSVVWRIILSGIMMFYTYMSGLICDDSLKAANAQMKN